MNLENSTRATMVRVHMYLIEKNDIQITALLKHQQNKALHSLPTEAEMYLTETGTIDDVNDNHPTAAIKKAKMMKDKYRRHYKKLGKEEVYQETNAWEVPKLSG